MAIPGSISRIFSGETDFHPVVKIAQIKGLTQPGENKPQRYRLSLMDGRDTIHAMLATQKNDMVAGGTLKVGSVIKLSDFVLNNLQGQQIIVLLDLDVIGFDGDDAGDMTAANVPNVPPSSLPPHPPQPPAANYPPRTGGIADYKSSPYSSRPSGGTSVYDTMQSSHRPTARDGPGHNQGIVPIRALNPYSNRWTIKARITNKSDIRRWSNARGEGTLFSIDLLDSDGGEIRATFFKDSCEKWFQLLEQQKVYTFAGGRLKVGDRKYSAIKNDYELTFDANSEIRPAADDDDIKSMSYNFTKIANLSTVEVNSTVDVLGIVRSATDCSEVVSQKMGGKVLHKRDLTLYDDSGYDVRLTLWGDKALADTAWHEGPIVACKGVVVGDYNGRTLGMRQSSNMAINPPIDEAMQLHQWRASGGDSAPSNSLSAAGTGGTTAALDQRISIASIKDDGLGMGEKPDYVSFKGTVTYIRHDNEPWYTACPSGNCNKKVLEGFNQMWNCEKCNQEFPTCTRRFILSLTMSDHSGQSWFSLFNDTAEQILGCTAEDLHQMKLNGDEAGYEAVFSKALFQTLIGKARIKQESVNDEMRVKSSIMKVDPINYSSECKQMIDAIDKYQ